jgi:hypothetical protein
MVTSLLYISLMRALYQMFLNLLINLISDTTLFGNSFVIFPDDGFDNQLFVHGLKKLMAYDLKEYQSMTATRYIQRHCIAQYVMSAPQT